MNKEIKKILDNLRKYIDDKETGEVIESKYTMSLILDYITNLEQGVQDLKADYGSKSQVERDLLEQENEKLRIQISAREEIINKAVEYMKFNATSNYFDKDKNMFRREEDLLNILTGGDEE